MSDINWWAVLLVAASLQFVSPPARSADAPSLMLQRLPLVEFARLVWGEVLREDYIFDAAFLAEPSEVSVDIRSISPDEARRLVVETAESVGFAVQKTGRVWRFGKPRPPVQGELELFYYRPVHRSVSYLADLLGAVFPGGSFSFQRGAVSASITGVPGVRPGSQAQPGGVDALGKSAASAPGSVSSASVLPFQSPVAPSSGAANFADVKSDAFIFRGPSAEIERLRGLLAQVDRPAGEVVVRAVVYEVRRAVGDSSAISLAGSLLGGTIGVSFGPGAGGNSLSVSAGAFRAVVSALSTDARFRAISSPTLRVQSGQSARFTVGDETPVLGNVSFAQGGQSVQAVEYRPSGVIFDLKPIVREGSVELDVRQQLSSFVSTTSGVNNSPTLLKRELQTVLSVQSGETVVLGGLEDSRSSEDRSGVAFLPRWLDSRGKSDERTEVLLVLDVQRVEGR